MSPHHPRRRRALLVIAGLSTVLIVTGLVIFKPWLLFVDTTTDDQLLPAVTQTTTSGASPAGDGSSGPADGPVLVASGSFVSHEHETTGMSSIYRLPDGSHQLALSDLSTSSGPDVRVWLSAGPVVEGLAGLKTAGEHEHLEVAPIKGNRGNQLYELPAGTDPGQWRSVVLWCEDFSVSFGAAELSTVA